MNQELNQKIKNFTDLNAWQEAHCVVLLVYKTTKTYPDDERFGLVPQMRRCAVSMTSNIAEGFSRFSYADKSHFYSMALGSNTELQNQLFISLDLKYVDNEAFQEITEKCILVNKLLNGLIKKSRIIHNS